MRALPSQAASAASVPAGIEVTNLRRHFGSVHALDGLDFTAPTGQVTALVGPNGSGKTTAMLILATLLAPGSGSARVGGFDPVTQYTDVRRTMGWMPDGFGTWDALTVTEILQTVAAAHRLTPRHAAQRIDAVLAQAKLGALADRPARVLSRGQQQRLGLARALLHDPHVLLLDEPASGLDPRSRIDLRDTVRDLAAAGKTILISSHILSELEEMSDQAVIVSGGRAVARHVLNRGDTGLRHWRLTSLDGPSLTAALTNLSVDFTRVPMPAGSWSQRLAVDVQIASDEDAATLLAHLVGARVPIFGFSPTHSGLEAAYLEATDGADGLDRPHESDRQGGPR